VSHKKSGKESINVYSYVNQCSYVSDVGRVYGVYDMYKCITSQDDVMCVEKALSRIESRSSHIVRKVVSNESFKLTRLELLTLKKFLFIMSYRKKARKEGRIYPVLDICTAIETESFKRQNGLNKSDDFWLYDIRVIVELSYEDLLSQGADRVSKATLQEYRMYNSTFMCVWEAPTGLEFIIGDASFGLAEGYLPIVTYHWLFPVSPRIIIVLCDRSLSEDFCKNRYNFPPSMFDSSLDIRPTVRYVKEKNSIEEQTSFLPKVVVGDMRDRISDDDEFGYRRIIVSKDAVYKINSIFLYHSDDIVSYSSSVSLLKTLIYYGNNKKNMFPTDKSFGTLRLKLFNMLNYTHG
jgi:hypothetical protein